MTGRRRGVVPVALVALCVCAGFAVAVGGAAAESSVEQSGAEGPSAERTLNTTVAEPGETVRVTATVTRDSAGPVDYLDEFEPAFAGDASLVSVTANGTPVSESVLIEFPDTIIVSVGDVAAGPVVVTYDVTVPETAAPGETYSFDGLAQTADEEQTPVGGESTLLVGGGAPTFEVALSSVPGSVAVGEILTVAATVTNTGTGAGTQQVSFGAGGTQQGSAAVTLDPGGSESVAFNYTATPADTPDLNVTVSSANETATETVAVTANALFEVAVSSVPESVTVGEELTVEAVVTNAGTGAGTQQVGFSVGGAQQGGTAVTLAPDESESVAFNYTVGETPEVNVTVSSANETATGTVAVTEPADFAVALSSVPESVAVGENLTVEATVTNVGDEPGTQQVTGTVDGETVTSRPVSLAGGASETVTVTYPTSEGDTPGVGVAVSSGNETAAETVTVTANAFFEVAVSSVPGAVAVGKQLSAVATVTNGGGAAGTQSVTVTVDGDPVADTQVTLGPGASETIPFGYTATSGDAPDLNVTVASANATVTASVVVTEQSFFAVTLSSVPESATVGDTATVEAEVTNLGGATGTQSVTVAVDGNPVTDTQVTLADGATETVTVDYTVAGADAPELAVTAVSEDDSAATTVAVLEPPRFDVDSLSVAGPVSAGAETSLTATVTNTGDVGATQSVTFAVDGAVETSRQVELAGGASETVTFAYVPTDTGERTLAVATENVTAVETLNVLVPATFDVRISSIDETVGEGEPTTVAFTVENRGGVSGTQTVVLSVEGEPVRNETLTLESAEQTTVTHDYTPTAGGPETRSVVVTAENDTASATVAVTADTGTSADDSTTPDDSETDTDNGADDDDNGTDAGDTTGADTDDASGPGFGIGAFVLALLGLCLLCRGQRAGGRENT